LFFQKKLVFNNATSSRYEKLAKKLELPKSYSARFEFYGNGKDLANAIRIAVKGIVPQFEDPFVICSARKFIKNPFLFGEGVWSGRPNIES
jgi:hypothetical protein